MTCTGRRRMRSGARQPPYAHLVVACAGVCLAVAASAPAQTTAVETCPPQLPAPATTTPASAESASDQLVACVGSQPITASLFRHWQHIAKRAEDPRRKHHPHPRALIREAMGFLIASYWVIGEARDLGVEVSAARVHRAFDHIRRERFPKRGEFRAFLRSSGETVADLLFRERVSLLSNQITRHIIAGKHGAEAEEAIAHYASELRTKWRAQTYCSPHYAVSQCGHVQAVL